jgi:hypothetical protein
MSSIQQTWTNPEGSIRRMPYSSNEIMSAIIAPTGATSITLQFTSFSTEFALDIVVLSRCTAINCFQRTELGRFSGQTIPGPVTSNTGVILIQWTSDSSVEFSGWSATWTSPSIACEIAVTVVYG